jgi:transcription antitermination factor NusG
LPYTSFPATKRRSRNTRKEAERTGLTDQVSRILILRGRGGDAGRKKKVKNKIFFPGYMLVEMEPNKVTQHLILNTPG